MRHLTVALWASAAILATVALGGCPSGQPGGGAVTPTTGESAGPAVELQMWTIWSAEPRKSALDQIVANFEAAHPGIRINVVPTEPDAYKSRIRVVTGSGSPPDIFFVWSGEWLHNFVRGDNVLPITAELDANNSEWRDRVMGDALKWYTFDGETYGIPFLRQCTFFFYNTQLFERDNVQPPATWNEFLAACDTLKRPDVAPIALGNSVKWPAHHYVSCLWQRLMGQDQLVSDFDPLGPGAYDDPGYVKGLQMFRDLVERGVFNRAPNGTTRENARALFYTASAAMFYTGTWDLNALREGGEAPEDFWDTWDWFNFPAVEGGRGDQQALHGGADGYVISSKTAHPEEAITFLKYLNSVEAAQLFVEQCKELVLVNGAVTEQNADEHLLRYARQVEAAPTIVPWADTLLERSVAEVLLDGCQALVEGSITPEQIMDNMRARQANVKRHLQELGGSSMEVETPENEAG
ncbi:MAG: extracellular solute-binding protein [candidate division WS1 bacterium]|jgi:raffinose/stachyose/melibiose transport system substrate-binding protein|nr:extracellular solute-binding protein [candidate division WS1 bacterium]